MRPTFLELATTLKYLGKKVNFMPCICDNTYNPLSALRNDFSSFDVLLMDPVRKKLYLMF